MDQDITIKVEDVSKKFCKNLNQSMRYGMNDILKNMFGKPSTSKELRNNEFWAVKDVSFEVRKGETLGLIGPNGSGKTTFLKMLNGIFWPDQGKISIRGKVGALIAVGAGFHPLLTGRENIYSNAAILGMNKRQVDRQFDSIIDFANIGDFLDTPVKNYSSGMFVRLGFAIAVHCEPDVLLVDEVLAVGDEGFRAKCYEKISELKKNCTIIFVSHSMDAIARICDRVVLFNKSEMIYCGDKEIAIEKYQNLFIKDNKQVQSIGTGEAEIKDVKLFNSTDEVVSEIEYGEPVSLALNVQVDKNYKKFNIVVSIHSKDMQVLAEMHSLSHGVSFDNKSEVNKIVLKFSQMPIKSGQYVINIAILDHETNLRHLAWDLRAKELSISGKQMPGAKIQLPVNWEQVC